MREVTATELYYLAKPFAGEIDHIYLHWSAGHYDNPSEHYHVNILGDGTILLSTEDLTERLPHTWQRNSRAIGVTICCCWDAVAGWEDDVDFGSEPPTQEQIEAMAIVVDVLCAALDIPMTYPTVMTHCEAAELDDYGPSTTCERWDLWYLPDYANDTVKEGGDLIRGKAAWYREHGY